MYMRYMYIYVSIARATAFNSGTSCGFAVAPTRIEPTRPIDYPLFCLGYSLSLAVAWCVLLREWESWGKSRLLERERVIMTAASRSPGKTLFLSFFLFFAKWERAFNLCGLRFAETRSARACVVVWEEEVDWISRVPFRNWNHNGRSARDGAVLYERDVRLIKNMCNAGVCVCVRVHGGVLLFICIRGRCVYPMDVYSVDGLEQPVCVWFLRLLEVKKFM